MSTHEAAPTVCPRDHRHWRSWLEAHHEVHENVWLVYHKKSSPTPNLTWSEAVDEALCFGWIDSRAQPIDADRYRQFFSRRKPKSGWSAVNKQKVAELIAAGKMTAAGHASIELAKENGAWALLDDVEALVIPDDLAEAFAQDPAAERRFQELSRSAKRLALHGLLMAKRPATRAKRIAAILGK